MTPQTFITKWGSGGPAFHLNEEQGAQSHFIDLCDLLGVSRPGTEAGYLFVEKNIVIGGPPPTPRINKPSAWRVALTLTLSQRKRETPRGTLRLFLQTCRGPRAQRLKKSPVPPIA